MSVQNVVLGQLIGGRGYGYELAERLRAFSDAIELSEAAVYASLRSLEEKGLIAEVARDAPAARANVRVIFEATPRAASTSAAGWRRRRERRRCARSCTCS